MEARPEVTGSTRHDESVIEMYFAFITPEYKAFYIWEGAETFGRWWEELK